MSTTTISAVLALPSQFNPLTPKRDRNWLMEPVPPKMNIMIIPTMEAVVITGRKNTVLKNVAPFFNILLKI